MRHPMETLEKSISAARAVDILAVAACGLLFLFLLDLMAKFVGIDAFRHDEIRYILSYREKLTGEGRWLNFAFFWQMRLLDVKLVACAGVLCFAVFSWCVFRNFLDRTTAVLAALVCLFIPPVHLLNEWALTSFISFFLLALAGLLHDKMRMPVFFLVFGVLFNGVLSHFHFLLPLLFLGALQADKKASPPPPDCENNHMVDCGLCDWLCLR